MKKFIKFSFVSIVFIAILFPFVKFNKTGTVSSTEKRTLAVKPDFTISDFSKYDIYLQDRFGGRDKLIRIANFVDYKIFNKPIRNAKAFKGTNGWFYFIDADEGHNLDDYYKINLLNETELENFKSSVKKTANWCQENGIKYLFIICPNKHSVYPENFISTRPQGITRTDQLVSVFDELSVPYIFPRDYLLEQKKVEKYPLYYETDTHWNKLGAYHAFEKIQDEIKNLFPYTNFPTIEFNFDISYSETVGDLLPLLGIKNAKSTQISVRPKNANFSDYFEYIKNEEKDGVVTEGKNKELPAAIVFRDSFFSALTPYFSTMFSHVEYNWRRMTDDDKEHILENKPDLIVFETVERYAITSVGD